MLYSIGRGRHWEMGGGGEGGHTPLFFEFPFYCTSMDPHGQSFVGEAVTTYSVFIRIIIIIIMKDYFR